MKTTIAYLVLVVLFAGCSKHAPVTFTVLHGDIAVVEITTNSFKGRDYYSVDFKLTDQKDSQLHTLAKHHPNDEITVVAGNIVSTRPGFAFQGPTTLQAPCRTHDDAIAVERDLKKLSQ